MNMIGMIVPSVDNSFFSALASAVERYMYDAGIQAVIYSSENDAEKEKAAFRHLAGLNVGGIICV